MIKNLNVSSKTVKLLGENIEEKLHDTGMDSDFLDMMPKTQATKAKRTMRTISNLKTFVYQRT